MFSSLALLGLTAIQGANAWGSLGHETVAYIASHYVETATKNWAQDILDDTSKDYLANVATWADSYRYTSAGKFSAPYHFIDAQDDPPNSCNVDYDRDCTGGKCVVAAIANYTTRVQSNSLSDTQVNYALRFIVHFLGDITQPLHDESYDLGGNDIDVTFNGDDTNLHASWDTSIPEQLIGGYSLSDAQDWANDLIKEIDSGSYESQKASWVSGLDINDAKDSAMAWATDANAFVCSVVAPNGWDGLENAELYPDYYNGVVDTVSLQIAKGGYRLAKWLDAIAAQAASKKVKREAGDVVEVEEDLNGDSLIPARRPLTAIERRRAAIGFGCGDHTH
ncbi:hypothetical protein PRZ48_006848 [Zasmidium cellare]|uniref:Nuclease PA3 n=1 Tax=Zasmidium cellare TaxID=395010 RepID=A0ABR0EHT9_ZASCE|nr:hypothetical protein PRZ48_006848 [Zasmidium cellare]